MGKGVVELPGKATAAVGAGLTGVGVFLSLVALKSLYGSLNDIKGAYQELCSGLEGEREQFIKLKQAVKELKKLKKLKKPQPVPQSKIDDVEKMLGPYGARLLGVDDAAKATATKLDKLLKSLEAGKFRDAKAQKAAEDAVNEMILKIIDLSQNVSEGRKLLQSAKAKVQDVSSRAKKDSSLFWNLVGGLWKVIDGLMDVGEKTLDEENTATFFENCLDVLKEKIEGEMDARWKKKPSCDAHPLTLSVDRAATGARTRTAARPRLVVNHFLPPSRSLPSPGCRVRWTRYRSYLVRLS
ncbi:hypothetical protein AYO44_06005 [Planctomycetaceae bacterium SCGC AG-212-F19]|nr:hypothetical protein AYO44_06005 [Planctomycetaceae bacterium SCGC AG-212-F19]